MKRRLFTVLAMLVLAVVFAVSASAAVEELSTAEDIINLMNDSSKWGGEYVLTDDINLADYTGTKSQARIGTRAKAFTGKFNGAGHTISGVNIVTGSADSDKRTGFFGWAAGATIENLTLMGKISSGQDGIGGIVGATGLVAGTTTTIRNCVNYCAVSTTSSNGRVGGIVGTHSANKLANVKLVVENCVNYGTLDAKKHIGGIIGRIEDGSTAATGSVVTIKDCANFGALTAPAANNDGVGGIVGTALPQNGTYTVENCYNAGTVNAPYRVGGIVGSIATYASTTGKMYIKNCVSTADITASYVSGSEGAVGGILGEVFNNGSGSVTVENCFVSGSITGKRTNKGANVGAIVGRTASHSGTFTCSTGNTYAANLTLTTAGGAANKTGATAIAVANLGNASAYPATFNTDGTYLFGAEGPFMKAVHNETIVLDGTNCVCALCEKKLLETTQINGETWIEISTAADLLLLMANSKAGNEDALGYNYILTATIDLKGDERQYPIGQPVAAATTPVGAFFNGKFDGDGHTIKGIALTDTAKRQSFGLFATVGGTDGNTVVIKDLTVEGTFIGNRFMGAVAGLIYGNAEITGCSTTANTTVTGSGRTIGGIVGAAVYNVAAYKAGAPYYITISDCTNNAVVKNTGSDSRTGGVIGQFNTAQDTEAHLTFTGNVNNGKVTGGTNLAGVIGYLEAYNGSALVEKCENYGTVEGTSMQVAGIIGYGTSHTAGTIVDIIDCVNYGTIKSTSTAAGDANTAGIIGYGIFNRAATVTTITGCINHGAISAASQGGRVGGIFGSLNSTKTNGSMITVYDCLNLGNITATVKRAGGIAGYFYTNGGTALDVYNCVNVGTVKAPTEAGGIVAIANGVSIYDCINAGTVTTTGERAGGIAAYIAETSSISGSLNMGTVSGSSAVSGIVGYKTGDKLSFADNLYMAGTLADADADATSVTAAAAKEMLMTWCLTYGPNADNEEPANSDHYRGTGDTCLVCGAEEHSAHAANVTMRKEVVVEPTCVSTGSMYEVCPTCLIRGAETELPVDPDNHDIGWDFSGDVVCYGCVREGCDHVEIALGDAIYVSADGDDLANGTETAPVASFNLAMDIAAKAGKDIEVRLIGKVTPVARQINEEYNTFTNSFEESPHTNTITITSAEGKNGEVAFTAALRRYFLYGPTTFENVKISCTSTSGVYIFGRGFKLIMGEGLTMVDVKGKTESSKMNAGVTGLGAPSVKTSDIKVYLFGGFYSEGGNDFDGLYEGADPSTYHADLTVLSGEYWTIGLFNRYYEQEKRDKIPVPLENATGTLTVGDITTAYLCTVSSDAALVVNNTAIDVHYVDAITANIVYRHVMNGDCSGTGNTINHIFYKDFAGATIGDFAMGCGNIDVAVNLVYAPEVANDPVVRAFDAKSERYRFGDYARQVPSETSLPEWCYANGGHTWNGNTCETCFVTKCTGSNHYYAWDLSGEIATAKCVAGCGAMVDGSTLDAIYVSDSGKPGAGLSAAAPLHSYALAQEIAAKLGKDAYIYLVGTVTPYINIVSEENLWTDTSKSTASYEEPKHENTITVATAPGKSKATLKISSDAQYYFLYGPTIFENLNIKATNAGTGKLVGDTTDSGGILFFARGFKIVMGNGVSMPKVKKNMTYTKDNSGITGLNATTTVSDSKVYVWGGFQKNGYYAGADEATAMALQSDVTILSGTYWTIGGGNRGFGTTERDGVHVELTVGDPTITTRVQSMYIVPFSSDSSVMHNSVANVRYTGRITVALDYRALFNEGYASTGNVVNHFFYKEFSGSKIGDFSVGAPAETAVNLYYATAIASIDVLQGFREKSDKYAQSYNQVGEEMSFPEWCVEHAGGHDWDANNVCSFCEITPCTHVENAWTVLTEPTCVAEGLEANRCTVCFEHLEERVIAIDPDAHDIVWTYGETSAVAACTREGCGYSVTNTYGTVTEIHVSGTGSLGGDFSAENPISDFGAAMAIAAAQTEDVTVYIHDIAIIPDSGVVKKWNAYVEPEHENKITITSYGDTRATLRFNGDTPNNISIVYALSGPTTFEDLEFSSWNATSRFYIVARHNALVLGEGLTSDYQRGVDSGVAGTDIIVIGGCYYKDLSPAGGCEGLGVDLTVLSGTYGAIIGGAYFNNTCCVDEYKIKIGEDEQKNPIYESHYCGDIRLTLGGDVMIRRQLYAGSYGNSSSYSNMNNIYIDVVGNITVASQFGFGPYGVYYVLDEDGKNVLDEAGNKVTAPYMAKNVYLTLRDGEINGGSFFASNDPQDPYVLGAVMSGDATTARIAEKLYVYADISNRAAKAMYDLVLATLGADEANDGKWKAAPMDESYCEINYGEHTDVGTAVPGEPSTCTVQGYETHHCSACGDYIVALPLAEHNYDAGAKITIAATCIAPEMEREVCTACGSVKHTITGNAFVDHTDPEKTGFCQVCNKDLTADCEHTFGEAVSFKSGCGDGTKRTCSKCGKVEVEVFGGGHNYGKYVVTVEPTETMPGIKTRTCKGCGKVETALLYATDALNASAVATDADGNLADFAIENAKLTKGEKAALNTLLQQDAYGSEVKISYETDGKAITNITYSIPVPAEYTEYENVRIVVRDDDGKIHFVDFQIEKGYIVFTF